MTKDKRSNDSENTGTSIDLGDDLVDEATSVLPGIRKSPAVDLQKKFADLDDLVKSAEILASEDLIEEAKKIYRKILRQDSHHVLAKKRLQEIQKQELDGLFSTEDPPRPRVGGSDNSEVLEPSRIDSESILSKLEKDLGLEEDSDAVPFLNQDLEQYCRDLNLSLKNESVQDRLDLGIAFWEMSFLAVAQSVFKFTYQSVCETEPINRQLWLSALSLYATSLISNSNAFEALLLLEPALLETDLSAEAKIDLIYLCALANEKLKKPQRALALYEDVLLHDAQYRDAARRKRNLIESEKGPK